MSDYYSLTECYSAEEEKNNKKLFWFSNVVKVLKKNLRKLETNSLLLCHILMFLSMALYSGNYVFFRVFYSHGNSAFLFSFLRSLLSFFILPFIYIYESRRITVKNDEDRSSNASKNIHKENFNQKCENKEVRDNFLICPASSSDTEVCPSNVQKQSVCLYELSNDRLSPSFNKLSFFRLKKKATFWTFIASLSGALRQLVVPIALMYTTAQDASIIQPSVPVFTSCLTILMGLEAFRWFTVLCILTCSFGLALSAEIWNFRHVNLGFYILLAVPISKGFQVVGLKFSSYYHKPSVIQFYQILGLFFFVIPLSFSIELIMYCNRDIRVFWKRIYQLDGMSWAAIFYSTIAIILICWRIQIFAIEMIGTIGVSLYQSLQPFFSFLMSYFILNERISLCQILGVIVVCAGLYAHQSSHYYYKKKQNRTEEIVERELSESSSENMEETALLHETYSSAKSEENSFEKKPSYGAD